jgi:uncharacterized protein
MTCFFVSDLHGRRSRYASLFASIANERPQRVFIGGDLLAGGMRLSKDGDAREDFVRDVLAKELRRLRDALLADYPRIYVIAGNDDPRILEPELQALEAAELWTYAHGRVIPDGAHVVAGYAFVPPSPFRLKDWERYDVSRYVDPGCVAPEDGRHSVPVDPSVLRYRTIKDDLDELFADVDLTQALLLFHAPPHRTALDRAALDGVMVEHAPVDVHVGSIAIRRFIEQRQPLATMHGHIHESARLTGAWRDRLGSTQLFGAAHDGPSLSLVRFDPSRLDDADRRLL